MLIPCVRLQTRCTRWCHRWPTAQHHDKKCLCRQTCCFLEIVYEYTVKTHFVSWDILQLNTHHSINCLIEWVYIHIFYIPLAGSKFNYRLVIMNSVPQHKFSNKFAVQILHPRNADLTSKKRIVCAHFDSTKSLDIICYINVLTGNLTSAGVRLSKKDRRINIYKPRSGCLTSVYRPVSHLESKLESQSLSCCCCHS